MFSPISICSVCVTWLALVDVKYFVVVNTFGYILMLNHLLSNSHSVVIDRFSSDLKEELVRRHGNCTCRELMNGQTTNLYVV